MGRGVDSSFFLSFFDENTKKRRVLTKIRLKKVFVSNNFKIVLKILAEKLARYARSPVSVRAGVRVFMSLIFWH